MAKLKYIGLAFPPEPPRIDKVFKSGESLKDGLSGRAPLDTEPGNYKADRRICDSKPKSEK